MLQVQSVCGQAATSFKAIASNQAGRLKCETESEEALEQGIVLVGLEPLDFAAASERRLLLVEAEGDVAQGDEVGFGVAARQARAANRLGGIP